MLPCNEACLPKISYQGTFANSVQNTQGRICSRYCNCANRSPLLGRRQIVLKYQNRHIVKVRGQSGLTLLIQHLHCARSLLRIELAYTYKQAAYRNNNSECPIAWTITEALSQRVFATAGGCIGAAVSLRADAGGRLGTLGGRLGLRRISHLIPLGELEGDGG